MFPPFPRGAAKYLAPLPLKGTMKRVLLHCRNCGSLWEAFVEDEVRSYQCECGQYLTLTLEEESITGLCYVCKKPIDSHKGARGCV